VNSLVPINLTPLCLGTAIDLFQEHILKEGPQNNESALEQAKDKQIADAIRKAVGIEKKDK